MLPGPPSALPPPPGLPNKTDGLAPPADKGPQDAASPQGSKRQREEDSDDDAEMEVEDDEGEMDMSDDD